MNKFQRAENITNHVGGEITSITPAGKKKAHSSGADACQQTHNVQTKM